MFVDYAPRMGGKTSRLIEWLRADKKRVMLTFNLREKARLRMAYADVANQIFEWREWASRRGYMEPNEIKEVGIDNADIILMELVRAPVAIITISEITD